jgi:hypothetical protein
MPTRDDLAHPPLPLHHCDAASVQINEYGGAERGSEGHDGSRTQGSSASAGSDGGGVSTSKAELELVLVSLLGS